MDKRKDDHRSPSVSDNPLMTSEDTTGNDAGDAPTRHPHDGGDFEAALRESEKRFRTSVETLLDGFAILSAIRDEAGRIVDFRYEFINDAGCRLSGRSREETLGRGFVELFPELLGSELFKDYIRTAVTGEPLAKEASTYSFVLPEWGALNRLFDIQAVKMGDGLAVTFKDVTERKMTEEQVARLASFPELNPNPVVEVDLEGAVRYVTPSGRLLFPDLEETGLSHPWLTGMREHLDRFRRGEYRQTSRIVAVGERHYHQALYHVEVLRRIRIYGIDITEQVMAQEVSRRRAEELETLLESVPVVVWIAHDPECLHVTGNRSADEFLGIRRGAESSMTASPDERPTHFKVLKDGRELKGDEFPVQRAARGEVITDFECSMEFSGGTVRHLVGNATPLYDAMQQPRGAVSAFIEITERKRMEKELRASLIEKDILLRELSHRTKNNMQVIVSLLSLQAAEVTDGKLLGVLEDAKGRIRAMSLVHEKLYSSNNVGSLDMKGYIAELVSSLFKFHKRGRVDVKAALELEEISLSVDAAVPFGLIVNELVSNSLKHAFPGRKRGTISVSMRRLGEEMEFRYRDDGVGLPRDLDLSRVNSLGLRLVHNLSTHQLRGTMELRHDPGAEFVFRFRDLEIMKRVPSSENRGRA